MMYEEENGHPEGDRELEDERLEDVESGFDPFRHLFEDPGDVEVAKREAHRRVQEFVSRMRRRRPTAAEEREATRKRIKREGHVTAVDLRRRTSEIIAALDRNEELIISYRGRWVGVITPISVLHGKEKRPPITRSSYFGYIRWAPRLRRNREWPAHATRAESPEGGTENPAAPGSGESGAARPAGRAGADPGADPGTEPGAGSAGSPGAGPVGGPVGGPGGGPGGIQGPDPGAGPGDRPGDEPAAPCPV